MLAHSSADIVKGLIEEHRALIDLLPESEVSARTSADASFRKTLLLAAASYFEVRLTASVVDAFREATNGSDPLVSFVQQKAVNRRYHDWFNWDVRNANKFFSAFGEEFKAFMEDQAKQSDSISESVRAFMEIGHLRNKLVHENFASFLLEKTVTEIAEMYDKALAFVDAFPGELRRFLQTQAP